MLVTRKIGKIVRGKATPAQLALACVLGAMIGFMPGFSTAAGMLIVLVLLLVILNANLAVAAMVGAGSKILSLLIMPVQFEAGRVLLDGPTRSIFEWAINAPVLAWFGFDYYATTGGLALGLIVGVVCAAVLIYALTSLRKKMGTLEEGSERYKRYTSKAWVRFLIFVFIGGKKGKKTYAELAKKKIGLPIRPLGVIFALLVVALLAIGRMFLAEPIVTAVLQKGLERANGATVDVGAATLDISSGRLGASDLAMADRADLSTDLLRARSLQSDIGTRDLLQKRVAFDLIEVADAATGVERARPGVLIGSPSAPRQPPPPPEGQEKTLDDYLKQAELWKERLAQVRQWLEHLSRRPDTEPGPGETKGPTLKERLRREIARLGYTRVRASHLVDQAPTALVRELRIHGLTTPKLPDEVLDVTGRWLSTQPWLVEQAPQLELSTRSARIGATVSLGAAARSPGASNVTFTYTGIPADTISQQLTAGAELLAGGTIDVAFEGQILPGGAVDAPLMVTIRNSTIRLPGAGPTQVEELTLPIRVRGPIDNPRVLLDDQALADALAEAGKAEAARLLREKLGEELDDAIGDKLPEDLKDKIPDGIGDALGGLLGGGKKKDDDK